LEALSKGGHTVERMAVASSMSIYGEGAYRSPSTGATVSPPIRTHEQLKEKRHDRRKASPAGLHIRRQQARSRGDVSVGRPRPGIPTVALRLFNAYGSRQALGNPYTGVAAIFISRLLNDQPPLVFEDGEQRRDFVHVLDVADAFATALESDQQVWDVFNVGSGRAVTINEIARTLARLLHKNIAPEILNKYRVGDIRHCFADITKIESVFGFRPTRNFEAGMAELIRWTETARRPVDKSERSMLELAESRLIV
jgi:dTDP-L-rhamnose 4-epimerase